MHDAVFSLYWTWLYTARTSGSEAGMPLELWFLALDSPDGPTRQVDSAGHPAMYLAWISLAVLSFGLLGFLARWRGADTLIRVGSLLVILSGFIYLTGGITAQALNDLPALLFRVAEVVLSTVLLLKVTGGRSGPVWACIVALLHVAFWGWLMMGSSWWDAETVERFVVQFAAGTLCAVAAWVMWRVKDEGALDR